MLVVSFVAKSVQLDHLIYLVSSVSNLDFQGVSVLIQKISACIFVETRVPFIMIIFVSFPFDLYFGWEEDNKNKYKMENRKSGMEKRKANDQGNRTRCTACLDFRPWKTLKISQLRNSWRLKRSGQRVMKPS